MSAQAHADARSWIDWLRENAADVSFAHWDSWDRGDESRLHLGMLIQSCAESPAEFQRTFASLCGEQTPNPLTPEGFDLLTNLVSNGIMDDWDIFLQWRDDGYRVVGESERKNQDARFRSNESLRVFGLLCGNLRPAPGLADVGALLQGMYEAAPKALFSQRKPGKA